MADTIIYKGRGNAEMYDDYMDFINYVFGFNGNEQVSKSCFRSSTILNATLATTTMS